jgi:2-polyprenyl-6-methoxyphenol hydroxylase-like FAD-dependent oxidoreductase
VAETGRRTALVVGSGVGGLAAAIALRRSGFAVDVLERASGPDEIRMGGGLQLWPNAMRALAGLGLADTAEAAGKRVARLEWLTHDEARLAGVDLQATASARGVPSVGVRRSDLIGVLLDAVGAENVSFGVDVAGFAQDADGVTLHCSDGRVRRGDVLVGADGLESTIRPLVVGDTPLRMPGVCVYQAIVEGEGHSAPAAFAEVWGRGARCGYYPVRAGTFWFAFLPSSASPGGAQAEDLGARRMLLERTDDWTGTARSLLETTPEHAITHSELVARDPVESWRDGRVTLLGDAAHPMTPFTGQGACQAIEDAVVLGACLRDEHRVETALARYEELRLPRTSEVTRRSWAAASAAGRRDRPAARKPTAAFAATFERVIWRQLEQTIGYDVRAAEEPSRQPRA